MFQGDDDEIPLRNDDLLLSVDDVAYTNLPTLYLENIELDITIVQYNICGDKDDRFVFHVADLVIVSQDSWKSQRMTYFDISVEYPISLSLSFEQMVASRKEKRTGTLIRG